MASPVAPQSPILPKPKEIRNGSVAVCPGCGVYIPSRRELPFLTRRAWRESVADKLGYNREFIVHLGERTRIHEHHFAKIDVKNRKPIGLPQFQITRINSWPLSQRVTDCAESTTKSADGELDNSDARAPEESCVIVNIKQLKLLLRQCHYCNRSVNEDALRCNSKGGVLSVKYWCNGTDCRCYRYWRSSPSPILNTVTEATTMVGIGITKLSHFFAFIKCIFPSERGLYQAAQTLNEKKLN